MGQIPNHSHTLGDGTDVSELNLAVPPPTRKNGLFIVFCVKHFTENLDIPAKDEGCGDAWRRDLVHSRQV